MRSFVLILAPLLFLGGCSENAPQTLPATLNTSAHALECLIDGLSHAQQDKAAIGKSFFSKPWVEAPSATTARDGLGPLFSANSCTTCHPHNGAGRALGEEEEMLHGLLLRFSQKNVTPNINNALLMKEKGFVPHPVYGAQLSTHGVHDVRFEGRPHVTYRDSPYLLDDNSTVILHAPTYTLEALGYGTIDTNATVIAPRLAQPLIGLGYINAIEVNTILAHADPTDMNRDGISGRPNWVWDHEANATRLGRFTWKASAPTLRHQIAAAAHNDMGLTTSIFPMENCTPTQQACLDAPKSSDALDMPNDRLDAIAYYLSTLKIPAMRVHKKGAQLFDAIGCTACHIPSLPTREGVAVPLYSDLLLHDMGEGLSDGRVEFEANGREWRTQPLWGIGLRKASAGVAYYLHDGRARSLEEAILWHDGEAQNARKAYSALNAQERDTLVKFLEGL